jgi:2-keto-4-pentenoate hydratase/2-oxohepta-3-ene-1,7-dioic acid hydratase in catechol pathway
MKLADHDGRAVLVVTTEPPIGIDIATASDGRFGPSIGAIYDRWDEFTAWAGAAADGPAFPLDERSLRAPSPEPRQVFAIGLNYRRHAEETGAQLPAIPATFTKFPACIVGQEATVALPSEKVDWEVELVVVIGRPARNVTEADAWAHVAGLTIGQDLSERDVQFGAGFQFALGKSYEGFGPMGPWLVTTDEFADPSNLALGCSIDGETVQDARTDDLVFSIPSLIAQLSAILTLYPGDVIFTGTPSGVGVARSPQRFLQPGQLLESWIEGIGTLRTHLTGTP